MHFFLMNENKFNHTSSTFQLFPLSTVHLSIKQNILEVLRFLLFCSYFVQFLQVSGAVCLSHFSYWMTQPIQRMSAETPLGHSLYCNSLITTLTPSSLYSRTEISHFHLLPSRSFPSPCIVLCIHPAPASLHNYFVSFIRMLKFKDKIMNHWLTVNLALEPASTNYSLDYWSK